MSKYYWSFNEEAEIWDHSGETIEDCIEEAIMYREDYESEEDLKESIETVFIGELAKFVPTVSGAHAIDYIIDQAWDMCGEVADGFLDSYSTEDEEKLDTMLTNTFNIWLKETGQNKNFGNVVNIKEFKLYKLKENE